MGRDLRSTDKAMKIKALLLILACAIASTCQAACWRQISASSNATISIDNCSLAQDGKYRKAWFRWEYDTPQDTTSYPVKKYINAVGLDYYDCKSRKSATLREIYYGDSDQGVVHSASIELKNALFQEPPPETIAETLMNYVCKQK